MTTTDSECKKSDHSIDYEAWLALAKQVDALEVNLLRAERRLKDIDVVQTRLHLVLAVLGFIFTLTLALSPYLGFAHMPIPEIISYVSAFAVLFFLYMIYVSYGNYVISLEFRRTTKYAIEDGRFALSRAIRALEMGREENGYA